MSILTPRARLPMLEIDQSNKAFTHAQGVMRIDDLIGGAIGAHGGAVLPFCLEQIFTPLSGGRINSTIRIPADRIVDLIFIYIEQTFDNVDSFFLSINYAGSTFSSHIVNNISKLAGTFLIIPPPEFIKNRTDDLLFSLFAVGGSFTGQGAARLSVIGRYYHPFAASLLHPAAPKRPVLSLAPVEPNIDPETGFIDDIPVEVIPEVPQPPDPDIIVRNYHMTAGQFFPSGAAVSFDVAGGGYVGGFQQFQPANVFFYLGGVGALTPNTFRNEVITSISEQLVRTNQYSSTLGLYLTLQMRRNLPQDFFRELRIGSRVLRSDDLESFFVYLWQDIEYSVWRWYLSPQTDFFDPEFFFGAQTFFDIDYRE